MRRSTPHSVVSTPDVKVKMRPKSNVSFISYVIHFAIIIGIVSTFGYLVVVARASELQLQVNIANRDLMKAQFELMQSKQIFLAQVTDSIALSPTTVQPAEFVPTLKHAEQVNGPVMPPLKPSLFDVAMGVNEPVEAPREVAQASGQVHIATSSQ